MYSVYDWIETWHMIWPIIEIKLGWWVDVDQLNYGYDRSSTKKLTSDLKIIS